MSFGAGPGPLAVLLVVVVVTAVGGRLLGIRLRWWLTLAAGFPGLVIGIVFTWALAGGSHTVRVLPTGTVLLAALVATMLIAVLSGLLTRPGRLAGVPDRIAVRGLPHPVRSLRARAGRIHRYLQVTRIVTQHGLAPYLWAQQRPASGAGTLAPSGEQPDGRPQMRARSLGRSLRGALEDCGGIFIKLGQVLSPRPDLVPPEVIAELSRLQDNVGSVPFAEVEVVLAAELPVPAGEVFARFDQAPLAAASIAQVHQARLASGEEIVVKVQRPGVRAPVERDLSILLRLARSLETRARWAREYRVTDLAGGFAEALREELDFRIEARNIAAMAGTAAVRIPAVHSALSTSRILVMERLDGVSARDAGPVLDHIGADRAGLARGLLECFLRQVMVEGTFHADPHPGNVLVLSDGQLALIDFGSVGRLDPLQQAGLRRLLIAVARRNPGELHDALLDLAEVRTGNGLGDELLERALAQFMAQHLGPGMVADASMFATLLALLAEFRISFPPVIAGVFRAVVTLEGTLAALAPGFRSLRKLACWPVPGWGTCLRLLRFARQPPTNCSRCCLRSGACPAASTGSPPRWNAAPSARTSACSPTRPTPASSSVSSTAL